MDPSVKQKFNSYPQRVRELMYSLRKLIYDVAEQEGIKDLTETLKWGEPSYISQIGSTIRIDWKAKTPEQYCLYFNCNTKLIETFKEVYPDTFVYQGNRAIVLSISQHVPFKALAHCISLSLRYKKLNHLPMLGV